jgi:hypothetical protein
VDLVSGTASQLYPVRRKPTAAYTRNVLGNPDKYSLSLKGLRHEMDWVFVGMHRSKLLSE